MGKNAQDMSRKKDLVRKLEPLTDGHFSLSTEMRAIFSDWDGADADERNRRYLFLRSTRFNQTETSQSENQLTEVRRTIGKESISVTPRALEIFKKNPDKSMAEAVETEPLKKALDATVELPEEARNIDALFLKLCSEHLNSTCSKGSYKYSQMESTHLQLKTPEEREAFYNKIWQGVDVERYHDVARGFYVSLSRLDEKIKTSKPVARGALETLRNQLSENIEHYVNGTINKQTFYEQSHQAIRAARPTLETHRGCSEIFSGLTRALSNFAALFGFRTDSVKKLDALKDELEKVKGVIGATDARIVDSSDHSGPTRRG